MQQVNLYLPEFRPRRVWLSLNQMVLALLAALVLIALLATWSSAQTRSLDQRLTEERDQLEELNSQVQTLTAQLPGRRGASVEEQVAALRADINRREQILQLMAQQNLGNAEGFSEQFVSLARHSSEDLSLAHFSLQSGGQYVELSGRVRQADAVPRYLQRLRQDQSFTEVGFGVLEVAGETEGRENGLSFSVRRAERDDRRRGRSDD